MKYLFSDWKRIEKILKDKSIYLFLDYDGTLAPIALTPGMAFMTEKTKDILRKLSKKSNHKIAIISGRALKDISKRVGLKNIVYVGNHGFEINGPRINFKHNVPLLYRKTLKEIEAKLGKNLSSINGVLIENKGFSLSVHYRLADKKNIPLVKARFYTVIFPYEFTNNVQVKPGKMVLEVKPPISWDKGKVV
ncbi:MAG: trehalose-phosphatase, partial [Candidatus Wildermuthbacteria bacterium]|nr:trehalose-phosphatase [Candidatus Wildermuthbacteria bacterium]